MTRILQDQIDLGSETALDLLVKSNEDKATLAATLTNKGTAANPDTETWSALLTKTADLNVEAGRAILDVPFVSRTIGGLVTGGGGRGDSSVIGIAWGRWAFYWKQNSPTVLVRVDLKNNTAIPNYNTQYSVLGYVVENSVSGVVDGNWFFQQAYVANNKIIMINTTTLTVYDVDEATGVLAVNINITLGASINSASTICGANSDLSKFLIYDGDCIAAGSHANFKFVATSDGSVTAASSVPVGSSSHICPAVYDNDLVFSRTGAWPNDDTSIRTVNHFAIDWDTLELTYTGYTFFCNGSSTYASNRKVLISATSGKRYIPYFYNATFLYCLSDGTSTKISEDVGHFIYNNASCPSVTELSDGGYAVINNYGLPIFLDENLELLYNGKNDINVRLITYAIITTSPAFKPEQQIYDEETQTIFACYYSYGWNDAYAAKFHVYIDKLAGYTRLHNGVTTPFWAQTTDADIEAGALDKAV